jgi:hypothetical protein
VFIGYSRFSVVAFLLFFPDNAMALNTAEIAIGIVASVALTVTGFSLGELYEMHSEIELLKQQNKHEERMIRTMKSHWKLHRWAHDEINDLRNKVALPPARWPDLGDRPPT